MPNTKLQTPIPAGTLRIADALEQSKVDAARAAEIRSRRWLASEYEELRRRMTASGDMDGLNALLAEYALAQREGRVVDDVSRNWSNMRKELGPNEWLFRRADVAPMYRWADHLDQQRGTAPVRVRFAAALSGLWSAVTRENRLATADSEVHLGALVAESLPVWLSRTQVVGVVQQRDALNGELMAQVQRERWSVLEQTWRELLDAAVARELQQAREPWTNPRLVWPYPMSDGMRWEPVRGDADRPTLLRMQTEGRTAMRMLGARARDALSGKVAAINADALDDPELKRLAEVRDAWGYLAG